MLLQLNVSFPHLVVKLIHLSHYLLPRKTNDNQINDKSTSTRISKSVIVALPYRSLSRSVSA
jgi:hypothetical protein